MSHAWRYSYRATLIGIEADSLVLEIDLGFRLYTRIKSKLYGIKIDDHEKFAKWSETLANKKIVVTTHMHKRNKMGRVLVTMLVDGHDVNKTLVDQGIATARSEE